MKNISSATQEYEYDLKNIKIEVPLIKKTKVPVKR